ncbi:MAG: putative membrane protein [halophilic archaeon J07HX5]|nr:MAG: putative membrane protein [halophilic archaeon J07HX5]
MSGAVARLPSTRAKLEAEFDRLIRANRFTISSFFPLNGIVLLVGSAEDWVSEPLAFHELLTMTGVLVIRSPLITGAAPIISQSPSGRHRTRRVRMHEQVYTIHTGWPYGQFEHVIDLGLEIAGVPLGLSVFFLPLVMNANLLVLLFDRPTGGPTPPERVGWIGRPTRRARSAGLSSASPP